MIAADADLVQQVDRLLHEHGEVVRVPGFLAALGEVARHHVDVVIGPLHAADDMIDSTAEAVRRLSPDTRLLATSPASSTDLTQAAVAAGFEAVLSDTPSDAELARELHLPEPPPVPTDQAEPTPATDPADDYTSDPFAPQAMAPSLPDDALGDTDLVEAVLRGQGELHEMALRLVLHKSGIDQLAFLTPDHSIPTGHISADVRLHNHLLGRLHAPPPANPDDTNTPPLTADQIIPWADWLARWLSLDQQFTRLRDLSLRDELTGVYNRRYFNRFLARVVQRAAEDRQQVTVMVFDIDDFKQYNDAYGHPAGDEILVEIARLMRTNCRDHDVVARIGGDEFAVIFWDAGEPRKPNSKHPQDVLKAAKRFQQAVCDHRFPKLAEKAAGNLTISAGLAGFPWDGRTPDELLDYADHMALRSKQQGKNAITFGPNAQFGEEG